MPLDKLFYVNVGKAGTFAPSGDNTIDTTASDIDNIFLKLKERNQKKILLYFHGGLVKATAGMETATRIVKYAGMDDYSSYPICFVWETGLMETLSQNFDTIKSSEFFKKLLVKIIKVAGKKLGIDLNDSLVGSKGVGSMSDQEIRLQLEKEAPFEETFENPGKRTVSLINVPEVNIESELYYESIVQPEVQLELEEEISNDPELIELAATEKAPKEAALMDNGLSDTVANGQKGILNYGKLIIAAVKITMAVIKRSMKKRDHGFYPTIIEEIFREFYINDIGTWVWGQMKTKAKDMWKADDFEGNPSGWHAGSYLLKKIKEYQEEVGELSIDMVGHSAGSVVICELFNAVISRNIGLNFRNIYFMAPACRCDLFANTILQNQEIYRKLRIFTMLDHYERKDHMVPVIYPRSLLYFISGVLEGKLESDAYILGLQRHIVGSQPYDKEPILNKIAEYLKEGDRMVYSVTANDAIEGMRSGSIKHGNFDNDGELTLESIFYLMKQ